MNRFELAKGLVHAWLVRNDVHLYGEEREGAACEREWK